MRIMFGPAAAMLFLSIPYAVLASLFYKEAEKMGASLVFVGLAALSFLYYRAVTQKLQEMNAKQHRILGAVSMAVTLLGVCFLFRGWYGALATNFIYLASVPVIYNIIALARLESHREKKSVAGYVAGVSLAPFLCYAVMNSFYMSLRGMEFIILFALFYTVLFMLLHILFISWARNKDAVTPVAVSSGYATVSFTLAMFFPLSGLLLNSSLSGGLLGRGGVVGDFSSPLFFVVAIVNAFALFSGIPQNSKVRLLAFYLKSAGYTYVLYFMVVFLPLIPMGFMLLTFIIGIYMFAPLLLTLWQGKVLWNEWLGLQAYYKKSVIISVFLLGIATLPALLWLGVHNDRANLENAVHTYIDYAEDTPHDININALRRALYFIRSSRYVFEMNLEDPFRVFNDSEGIPILSNLYKRYILKNRTLGYENLETLERLFFAEGEDEDSTQRARTNARRAAVLSDLFIETSFDKKIDAYRTWVHMELQNPLNTSLIEYATKFRLPDGVFVSDYYLYVGDEKKAGILSDRRAALFIYEQIVSRSLDPGILHHVGTNTLELRVFPFSVLETRRTGFEVIHKGAFELKIDDRKLGVGGAIDFKDVNVGNSVLLSAGKITTLPALQRTALYNFVIDCSAGSDFEKLKRRTLDYISRENIAEANIHLTSYKTQPVPLGTFEKSKATCEGAFNFGYALSQIFRKTETGKFPLVIAVTDALHIPLAESVPGQRLFPESPLYYLLTEDLNLNAYAFEDGSPRPNVREPLVTEVGTYEGSPVAKDGRPHIVLLNGQATSNSDDLYRNALRLRGEEIRSPFLRGEKAVSHIKDSFKTKVMTRLTAFIVVETAQQEQDLLKMQERILSKAPEQEEALPPRLSEPPISLLLLLGAALLTLKRLLTKKSRCTHKER